MNVSRLAPLALLLACSQEDGLNSPMTSPTTDVETTLQPPSPFQIMVHPAQGAGAEVLSQRFRIEQGITERDFNLKRSTLLRGEIQGLLTNPAAQVSVGDLPSEELAVEAEVRATSTTTDQTFGVHTIDGAFEMSVLPSTPYTLTIIPDDARFPLTSTTIEPQQVDQTQDIHLNFGAIVYGRISAQSTPLSNALVYAVSEEGYTTSPVFTGPKGNYQLHVQPGLWTVYTEGTTTKNPILAASSVEVAQSALIDIDYPTAIGGSSRVLVSTTIVNEDDAGINSTIRLFSEHLYGFEGHEAYWEGTAQSLGSLVEITVPPGEYTIDISPLASDVEHSGQHLYRVDIDETTALDVVLKGFIKRTVKVTDHQNESVPGSTISCRESGFSRRAFQTTLNESQLEWSLPTSSLACTVSPPGDNKELARRLIDWSFDDRELTIDLSPGQPLSGQVYLDDTPQAYAVLEIRDEFDRLLNAAITDEEGTYSVRIDAR